VRAYAAVVPKALLLARARRRRRRLTALPVAVTGSVGKTTTAMLLAAGLGTVGPTVRNRGGQNRAWGLVGTVGAAGSGTRFLVQEIGASVPGSLDELLWALEPRVTVITTVRGDHRAGLGGPEGAAAEKARALQALPNDGLAVLNADDPRVRGMGGLVRGRVVLAGRAEDADVRIVGSRLDDDGRLETTLRHDGATQVVSTRLQGLHWETAVALAFAGAVALGGRPDAVAGAIAAVPPSLERLAIFRAPTGTRYLVDTGKATEATIAPALAAFAAVPAQRRIAVVGSLWDFAERDDGRVVELVTQEALAVAEEVLLYGPAARRAPGPLLDDPRVRAFTSLRALSDELHDRTGDGDLVLLKGTFPYDHLVRAVLRYTHDVRCWSDTCAKRVICQDCRALGPPLGAP
jgi:UDP-N-acetylmuramoyl-tripeptide--D-alanyl-D-alanine ligase